MRDRGGTNCHQHKVGYFPMKEHTLFCQIRADSCDFGRFHLPKKPDLAPFPRRTPDSDGSNA